MDKINEKSRESVFEQKVDEIRHHTSGLNSVKFFSTSIWNESLFKAWSDIVTDLLGNKMLIMQD